MSSASHVNAPPGVEQLAPGCADSPAAAELPMDDRGGVALTKALVLVVVVASCIAVVAFTPLKQWLAPGLLQAGHWVERFGLLTTAAGFVLIAGMGIAIAVPRVLIAIAAGALFAKPAVALAVAQTATMVGCWINFAYARALGRDYVRERLGARFSHLARVLNFIDQHGLMGNILIRSLPVGNCFAMNLLMAVSPVRLTTFLIGTAIGTLPSTVIYVLLGNSTHEHAATKIGLSAGIMILWCVPYALWLRRRRARTIQPAA